MGTAREHALWAQETRDPAQPCRSHAAQCPSSRNFSTPPGRGHTPPPVHGVATGLPRGSRLGQRCEHDPGETGNQCIPLMNHYWIRRAATESKSQSSKVTPPTHTTKPQLPLEMSVGPPNPQLQGQGVFPLLTFRSQYHPRAEGCAGEITVITRQEGWLRELRLISNLG